MTSHRTPKSADDLAVRSPKRPKNDLRQLDENRGARLQNGLSPTITGRERQTSDLALIDSGHQPAEQATMHDQTRRGFLTEALTMAAGGVAAGYFSSVAAAQSKSPNEKLNIACVGVDGRGGDNVRGVQGENIVAICDIDDRILARAAERFP